MPPVILAVAYAVYTAETIYLIYAAFTAVSPSFAYRRRATPVAALRETLQ